MEKKLTLEDLKLESFLTEIDNSKLVKMQGGNGAYGGDTDDSCDIDCTCTTDEPTEPSGCGDCSVGDDCVTAGPICDTDDTLGDYTTDEPTEPSGCGGCPTEAPDC